MKNFAAILFLGILMSFSAFAEYQTLVSLSCLGANGLQLNLSKDSNAVRMELGSWSYHFETNRKVFLISDNSKQFQLTRIVLGAVGEPEANLYDIYLEQPPVQNQPTNLTAVFGPSVSYVVINPMSSPITVPVGFVASATMNCNIITK